MFPPHHLLQLHAWFRHFIRPVIAFKWEHKRSFVITKWVITKSLRVLDLYPNNQQALHVLIGTLVQITNWNTPVMCFYNHNNNQPHSASLALIIRAIALLGISDVSSLCIHIVANEPTKNDKKWTHPQKKPSPKHPQMPNEHSAALPPLNIITSIPNSPITHCHSKLWGKRLALWFYIYI